MTSIEYVCFNQEGDISALNGSSLKLEDKLTYLSSSVSSTKSDINIHLANAWTPIDRLFIIQKSDLSYEIKWNFFQAEIVSIPLYGSTIWMLIKCIEKNLDKNCTRMLWAILNKSWKQHPTKQQLYTHLLAISKTIQIRQTRHMGHFWRSKDKLLNDLRQYVFFTTSYQHNRTCATTITSLLQVHWQQDKGHDYIFTL